ncbi:MAG: hypothetical protein ACOC7L_00085 [Acidobacteriota bacterium]
MAPTKAHPPQHPPEGPEALASAPRASIRELLDARDHQFLRVLARQVWRGTVRCLPSGSSMELARIKNGMLSWAVSDEPYARRGWAVLADHPVPEGEDREAPTLRDRDRYVETLWQRLEGCPAHSDFRTYLDGHLGARAYYRERIFEWFLRRFNPRAAFRIGKSRVSAGLFYTVLLVFGVLASALLVGRQPVALVVASLGLPSSAENWCRIGGGLGFLASFLVVARCMTGMSWASSARVLFPRLGAAVAIGYVFLAGAPQLVRVIAQESDVSALALTAVLVGGTLVYTVFHVYRRVHPPLRLPSLLGRAAVLVSLGASYAALGTAVFLPLLTYEPFHDDPGLHRLTVPQTLLLGSVALVLGMALELAWEEKPLTEPI